MNYEWMIPVLILILIMSLVAGLLVAFGPIISSVFSAYGSVRRYKTEQAPRDHYARWIHAHRRSAMKNKPPLLTWMRTTGDTDVPEVHIGRVKGCEPWRSFYLVFVKVRRLTWSEAYLIPQVMVDDLNGRTMWVNARGFSRQGPINIPIPLEDVEDLDGHILDLLERGFRSSFFAQVLQDIKEESAWDVDNAMSIPYKERVTATSAEQPNIIHKEYVPEEKGVGMVK